MLAEPVISKPDFNFLQLQNKRALMENTSLLPGEKLISITTLLSHF